MALFLKQEAELHGTYTVQQINIYPTGVQVSANNLTIYPYLVSVTSIITLSYFRTQCYNRLLICWTGRCCCYRNSCYKPLYDLPTMGCFRVCYNYRAILQYLPSGLGNSPWPPLYVSLFFPQIVPLTHA